jgi:hypothetical protein
MQSELERHPIWQEILDVMKAQSLFGCVVSIASSFLEALLVMTLSCGGVCKNENKSSISLSLVK